VAAAAVDAVQALRAAGGTLMLLWTFSCFSGLYDASHCCMHAGAQLL